MKWNYELKQCEGVVVEQLIRPTGLLDPEISVRPIENQIDDLLNEIYIRVEKKERVLITTLTKKSAESLTSYLADLNIKVQYIHSEVDTLLRVEILRQLRLGEIDVLVGVNLLREGLDMPEVSLVAVLDADKESFLRSERSLLQIAGRTARNEHGLVIFYADVVTKSMQKVIDETNRRRKIQQEYNKEHEIVPKTVFKTVDEIITSTSIADITNIHFKKDKIKINPLQKKFVPDSELEKYIIELEGKMKEAAKNLDFEAAAVLRDEMNSKKDRLRKITLKSQ